MPRRNSPNDIADLGELSGLSNFVFDKRRGQRTSAKQGRRNRHYAKQFIRNTLAHPPQVDGAGADEQGPGGPPESPGRAEEGS